MMSDATQRQNRASRPESSTWVSANAGSGKTRVLTDRVARLLLNKNDPQKILCLTYTKAAAAEMQNRLFQRLGKWAMLDDAGLRKALSDIGENGENYGVSPQFREMEEGQSRLLRKAILDQMARDADTSAFDALSRHLTNEDGLDRLLMDILKNRALFEDFDRARLAKTLRIDPDATEAGIVQETLALISQDLLKSLGEALLKSTNEAPCSQRVSEQVCSGSSRMDGRCDGRDQRDYLFGQTEGSGGTRTYPRPRPSHFRFCIHGQLRDGQGQPKPVGF